MRFGACFRCIYSQSIIAKSEKLRWALNPSNKRWLTTVSPSKVSIEGGIGSPYHPLSIPEVSLSHFMLQRLTLYGDHVALINGLTGEEVTYAQLHHRIVKVASALTRSGVRKGDVIAMFSPNCVEYAVFYLGAIAAGAVVSTLNPLYTAYELQHAVKETQCRWLVCAEVLVPVALEVRKSYPKLKEIFVFGSAEGCRPFKSLLEDDGKAFPTNIDYDAKNDLAVLQFSSGTTGLPKGVMLTHYNLVANIEQTCSEHILGFVPGYDVIIAVLPFFHIYGQVVVMLDGLACGVKIICLPKFDPEQYLKTIANHRVSIASVGNCCFGVG